MIPVEWRNVRKGVRLVRRAGGSAFLTDYGYRNATVKFPNGEMRTLTHEQLFRLYRPV